VEILPELKVRRKTTSMNSLYWTSEGHGYLTMAGKAE
jgi:hypothetical protein